MGYEQAQANEAMTNDKQKIVDDLKGYAIRGLQRMYLPEKQLFVFHFKQAGDAIVPEGTSLRYTAISLIGLAECDHETAKLVLKDHSRKQVCERLHSEALASENLGDIALCLWAANCNDYPDREDMIDKLLSFEPDRRTYPTVELSWTVDALCRESRNDAKSMAEKIALRLMNAQVKTSGVFPHHIGKVDGFRQHVSCFADAVYPIHALSTFYSTFSVREALDCASRCAHMICTRQGSNGQWWWHYDVRTGHVVEGYPVYSVHQDSMGPMALLALQAAGGPDYRKPVFNGLEWLYWSEEIKSTLMDKEADLIWRKVARKEPNKLSRLLQALASKPNPSLRFPFTNTLFPPGTIDYENRPYHLGWILYAWNQAHTDIWMQ